MSVALNIAIQEPVEMFVAKHVANQLEALIRPNPPGRDADKDFTLMVPHLVEVKCDFRAADSGNFFFEDYNCIQNKPSGLAASKAHEWYYFVPPNSLFSFHPKAMLNHLKDTAPDDDRYEYRTECGINKNSNGWIVAIDVIKSTCPFVSEEALSIPWLKLLRAAASAV